MKSFKRTTVTAALPYANGPVHIGHLAGCYLPADVYVRFLRRTEREVAFICGSDEHGMAITIKARKEGKTPQEIVDHFHGVMQEAFKGFGISFDVYSRTSSALHRETAAEFFKNLYDRGLFTERSTEQYFDPEAQQFLADRYIVGDCPRCGFDRAYGDQCENCGSTLSPTELKNPKSTLSGATPVLKETTHWFLPLDQLAPKLREYINSHDDWKPNVYGQCKSWLDQGDGLQPRSMTRDLDWGVPVPVEGAEGKVLYVWFDAPIGYITATKELKGGDWEKWWKDSETRLVHFIGKDNIVFHCIIFPAILMEHGGFILADQVPANEFLNLEGEKISTSRNWAVWLHEYLQDFPGQQDVLRYVLAATAPETKDNDFTWKDFQTRNNSELVAIYGNLVNRVVVLTQKFYQGQLPALGELLPQDHALREGVAKQAQLIGEALETYKLREALGHLMDLARAGNKYLAEEEPWKAIKTNPERAATVLHLANELTAVLAWLTEPFMPFTAEKVLAIYQHPAWTWEEISAAKARLQPSLQVGELGLLFSKIEDETIQKQLDKLEASKVKPQAATVPAAKAPIPYEQFAGMDLRVATIKAAAVVPKTDKLLQLTVDTGLDVRTVVSGIANHYAPEELVGKQVVLLANLEPRKIRGIESQGMILMAEDSTGKLVRLAPELPMDPGSSIS